MIIRDGRTDGEEDCKPFVLAVDYILAVPRDDGGAVLVAALELCELLDFAYDILGRPKDETPIDYASEFFLGTTIQH
jgi:hypothetical protein